MQIELPYNFKLRDYQRPAWDFFEDGGKRACLIWHRRAGKDIFSFNRLIYSAFKQVGNYWHVLPFYTQARKAIWEARTKDGQSYLSFIPPELIKNKRDNDMSIQLRNGSIIRLVGGDKPDSLVGAAPLGVVISEWALQRPSLWQYIEPMLLENKGWAIFNTTPRGDNHAKDTFEAFQDNPNCYASLLSIKDTDVISEDQIKEVRASGTPEESIQQEYYCSFEGAIHGSYYGDVLKNLKEKKQITSVPYDTQAMVHTYWDLGISDMTAIWFIQLMGKEIRVIDYYENNGQNPDFYVDLLLNVKDYKYGSCNLPHDGGNKTINGASIQDQLRTLGISNVKVHPKTTNVYADITKTRAILPRCWFDAVKCKDGLESLKQYRREWDEERKCFKTNALHDWSSHGADAFRLFGQSFHERMQSSIRPGRTVIAKLGGMI